MNTSIMVNMSPIYRRQFRGEIYSCPLQKRPSFSLQFGQEENTLGTHLKEELADFFESYHGILHSHRQSRKNVVNTLLMVNNTLIFKRFKDKRFKEFQDKSLLFTHFYLVSPASREYIGIKPTTSVSWCTTPVSLYNLIICVFKKDIFKNIALDFMLMVLK